MSQNLILKAQAMPLGVTFWYHSQKSMSSRFSVLSGSCLTAGGHTTLFINQVCIMLVNSFAVPGCIMNGVGSEAWACAFSCFRAHDRIVCSSGVHLLPFLALATSRASLNSGLSMEHVCCHVFCCKFDKQTPNLCPYQFYLHSTQASYICRKIFIKTPKLVAESQSIALFDHNRRGYQCGTRPDQCASKYVPEQTTGGTYISHGHFIYFYLIIFLLSIRDCICLSS